MDDFTRSRKKVENVHRSYKKDFLGILARMEKVYKVPFQRVMKPYHVAALAVGGTVSSVYFLGNGYLLSQIGPFAFLAFAFGGADQLSHDVLFS